MGPPILLIGCFYKKKQSNFFLDSQLGYWKPHFASIIRKNTVDILLKLEFDSF